MAGCAILQSWIVVCCSNCTIVITIRNLWRQTCTRLHERKTTGLNWFVIKRKLPPLMEMLFLIYIPSNKHIPCQIVCCRQKRNHGVSPTFTTKNFDSPSPYPYDTPKFCYIFVKRCFIVLVYITFCRLAKEEGLQAPSPLFGGRELIKRPFW